MGALWHVCVYIHTYYTGNLVGWVEGGGCPNPAGPAQRMMATADAAIRPMGGGGHRTSAEREGACHVVGWVGGAARTQLK